MQKNEKYILADGIFSIGNKDIGITRGGGVFEVLKEYRALEHDGARSEYVKNRIHLDRATPKLAINALSLLDDVDSIKEMYANVRSTEEGDEIIVTGDYEITEEDYKEVSWRGFLSDGRACKIIVKNAINLENINWALVEKNEIIHVLNFTGTPEPGSKEQPWEIRFKSAATPVAQTPAETTAVKEKNK